jgi:hypothetical protein
VTVTARDIHVTDARDVFGIETKTTVLTTSARWRARLTSRKSFKLYRTPEITR